MSSASDHRSVLDDAKMLISTLQAKLTWLRARGGWSSEVNQQMKELLTNFLNKDLPQPLRIYYRHPVAVLPPSFPNAETYKVKPPGYTGTTLGQLVASPGDRVIVFGSIPGTDYAVAYNTRTEWGGHLPISVLEREQSQPQIDFKLHACDVNNYGSLDSIFADRLEFAAGDYIRVIRGDGDVIESMRQYGLNLRTLKFGTFDIMMVIQNAVDG